MISVETYEAWPNLCALFFDTADRQRDRPFLWAKRGGVYRPTTWGEAEAIVSRLSRGLRTLGIEVGDRVAIVAENRPEWPLSELAILSIGAVAVPAYTTNTIDDHVHILDNSGAKAAIVSTPALANDVFPAAVRSKTCKTVIAIEQPNLSQSQAKVRLHEWDDVLAAGDTLDDEARARASRWKRTDTAMIIHTSGTGGAPRGVTLSHGNILANCMGAYDLMKDQIEYGREVFLSFLPLSHAYEHMAGQFVAISMGAQIYYAESADKLVANMAEVRPTIMTAVPRLYEAIHSRITRQMAKETGLRKTLFEKAVDVGKKRYASPDALSLWDRVFDRLLDVLIRRKVAQRFGGRLKFFVSGGAPLNYDIGLFFSALGVKLLQGYGQTEAAPLISCNPVGGAKIESVGPPVKGVEVMMADDGEICVRGELVMKGYWGDERGTEDVIRDGWLCTGDIGHFDEDGHIRITDRKKDIIVNSGGDNIAPARVEGYLTLQPEIGQAMVIGDKRPHLVALIVPEEDYLKEWSRDTGKSRNLEVAANEPDFHDAIAEAVSRVNRDLPQVERVRRFLIAPEPFSVENGMMTPSMKIRRHVIKERFGPALEKLYRTGA